MHVVSMYSHSVYFNIVFVLANKNLLIFSSRLAEEWLFIFQIPPRLDPANVSVNTPIFVWTFRQIFNDPAVKFVELSGE